MKRPLKIFGLILAVILAAIILSACEKPTEPPPGEVPYCVECVQDNGYRFDTCASLDACNEWAKKYNEANCYYRKATP